MNMQEENRKLLELYAPLRVADVRDGMDWMGYHHYGTLASDIRPLWRTRAFGIAVQNQLFNPCKNRQYHCVYHHRGASSEATLTSGRS